MVNLLDSMPIRNEVVIGAVILLGLVILTVSIVAANSNRQRKSNAEEMIERMKSGVNSVLRGNLKIDKLKIGEIGAASDFLLTKENVIKQILVRRHMKSATCDKFDVLSILIFSDVITPHMDCKDCSQMIELVQTLSKLDTNIDFVLVDDDMGLQEFINYMITNNMRFDALYNSIDSIVINRLCDYDIILHSRSGLNSAYEIITGVLTELGSEGVLHMKSAQNSNENKSKADKLIEHQMERFEV